MQLEGYLVKNNLLYEFQSGFRSKFSTDTCLSYLTDFIKHETSKGLYTGMIMLDLQKAFDTVDHLILCEKLRAIGVGSVDWLSTPSIFILTVPRRYFCCGSLLLLVLAVRIYTLVQLLC